jgi:hypothetical protein
MPEEKKRLQIILSIEASLEVISKELASAVARSSQQTTANSDGQITKLTGKEVLDILQLDLKTLQSTCSIIHEISCFFVEPTVMKTTESDQLANIKISLMSATKNMQSIIKQQEETIQGHSVAIEDSKAQQELQEASCELIQASSQCLADIRKQIKEESESWRRENRSIWRIPTEIWETIFQFTLQGELKDYLDSNTKNPLRSTPIFLSQVCSHWRLIVQQEPRLLALVYGPPAPSWYPHEYDRLTESLHRNTSDITVLTNLSHIFPWGYHPVNGRDASGELVDVKALSCMDIFGDKNINLHIYRPTKNDDSRLGYIPFRQSTTMTITMGMYPCLTRPFFKHLHVFESLRSLTITTKYPGDAYAVNFNLKGCLPQLRVLKIFLKMLPDYWFFQDNMLTPMLEEFHLHHELHKPGLRRLGDIELPNLRTLGISFFNLHIYQSTALAAIKSLVLYGSSLHGDIHRTHIENIGDIYRQLSNLCFEGWVGPESSDQVYGVANVLEILARNKPTLKSIKISDSFVDGVALVRLFKEAGSGFGENGLNKVRDLTLSYTHGVTRSQCDELSLLVPKLTVHV